MDIYIYGVGIEGDWGAPTCVSVGLIISPGQERDIGVVHFSGPSVGGGYYSYSVKHGLMVSYKWGDFIYKIKWWDYGYVGNASKAITFLPYGTAHKYEEKRNPAYYFDKANKLMNPKNADVKKKATELTANYSGSYSIYQAAAAFGFVRDNVRYVIEPKGTDHWQAPEETLRLGTGDCEDYAFLLSALVTAMGGTTRFHVEKEHAFLSVYAGTDLAAVQAALERYYNTPLKVAAFQDSYGYWLGADATNSMYLGGLPLGGEPLASGWDLTNTTFHYEIDMLPK
jgi:transglutaminase-like putative cysteine protease